MFEGVGLSAEEEETYLGLLAKHGQTLDEIAAMHPERPRRRTLAVLGALMESGLATQLAAVPMQYVGIAPDVAIGGLVRARIDDARRVQQALPTVMEQFWSGHGDAPVEFVEILSGREAILQRWGQLGRAVGAELRAFDCPPYFANPLEPDSVELERLSDGVRYRVIYEQDVLRAPGRWADVETGIAAGEHARVLDRLPAKLTLFDDFAATLPIAESAGHPGALIVIHRSPLLDALSALFEMSWASAVPVTLPEHDAGDADESRLVQLLVAGLGDHAIQRALGVSASTVHRRVHALMARLGSKTRFQAGVQVGRGALATRRPSAAYLHDHERSPTS